MVMTAQTSRVSQRRPIEPGTRAWDEVGLVTFTLSGGAAFLLQTMDPTIGPVVDGSAVVVQLLTLSVMRPPFGILRPFSGS